MASPPTQAAAQRLSVILITGNVIARSPGAAIFERVLQSVAWADELVVVDSDSTDGTRELAARYTDRIYTHPFQGSLKQQKIIALSYSTGDWVLWVDADEVLPPALIAEIKAALLAPAFQAYQIERHHYFVGRLLQHAGDDAKVRLWRRGVGAWDGEDNDDFYTAPPPVGRFTTPLEHYSTLSLHSRLEKIIYFAPAHAALAPVPPHADYTPWEAWRLIFRPSLQRIYGELWVQRGYKDGLRGWLWAFLCGMTEFIRLILIWERAQGVNQVSSVHKVAKP